MALASGESGTGASGRRDYTLGADALGAAAGVLISVPQALSLGLIAFLALGPEWAVAGVVGTLLATVIGSFVAALLPSGRCQTLSPRSSATVVFAGIVAAYAAHPLLQSNGAANAPMVVALAGATLFLAGLIQVGFAFTGVGRMVRFVPHPVVAGFMNGIALAILLAQIPPVLGGDAGRPWLELVLDPAAMRPGAVLVALATLAAIYASKRCLPRAPEALIGLGAGIALHALLARVAPGSVGPVVGPLPVIDMRPEQFIAMLELPWAGHGFTLAVLVLPYALLLAAVVSLDGLLAALVGDTVTDSPHDSRRLLAGQGAASMIASGFGALPAVASANTRIACHAAGGRGVAAIALQGIFVLFAVLVFGALVSSLPVAALAGLMVYIALSMIDHWSGDQLRRLRDGREHRGEIALNLGIVVSVAIALPLFNVMAAFALGVAAAVLVLLAGLSGTPVRRVLDGTVRTSLKVRDRTARGVLGQLAHRIRILELEGEIFFGTAEGLREEIERMPADTRYVVLDFRRVNHVDASGARVLQVIGAQCARRSQEVLLAHVAEDEPRGRYLRAVGVAATVPVAQWYRDLDRALEWAEDMLLEQARFQDAPEIALRDMAFFDGLTGEELGAVVAVLQRHELGHGDMVFAEGDVADRLYLIARGFVSIKVRIEGEGRALRLATLSPGVLFGEAAMLEGQRRSGDGFAKGERVVLYSLAADRVMVLVRDHPVLALKLYRNLAHELMMRVRSTSQALRAME